MSSHEAALIRALGFDPQGPAQQIRLDETLPLTYPMALYRIAGQTLMLLTPAFEEAEAMLQAMPVDMTAAERLQAMLDGVQLTDDGSVILALTAQRIQPVTPDASLKAAILGAEDAPALEALMQSLTPQEREEAGIQADDPLVAGVWQDGRLIAAAGLCDWGEHLGDVSVATHPSCRRRGAARLALHCLCCEALAQGWLVQYRHDRQNTASAALAKRLGFFSIATQEGAVVTYL